MTGVQTCALPISIYINSFSETIFGDESTYNEVDDVAGHHAGDMYAEPRSEAPLKKVTGSQFSDVQKPISANPGLNF